MKKIRRYITPTFIASYVLTTLFGFITGCDDFVQIGPPRTDLVTTTVFSDANTAEAAVLDMYYHFRASGFSNGTVSSISYLASLSSDEQINFYASTPQITQDIQQFSDNDVTPANAQVLNLWRDLYEGIYKANNVLKGLEGSSAIPDITKARFIGEAKFIRAFCHFYLVNLFGSVPIVLTTDYKTNSNIARSTPEIVYEQISSDLREAQAVLSPDYASYNNERVRATKGAATALLARTYLYNRDWVAAEAAASEIIENTSLYQLSSSLTEVFRGTGKEAIFQIWSHLYPNERNTFSVSSAGPFYGALRPSFVNQFEAADQRWAIWGRSRNVQGTTYYYTLKYLSFAIPPLDYSTPIRIAECYLIRAEARAQLNKIQEAVEDLNVIRARAGLSASPATTQPQVLLAIEQERRSELFTEWGHRWFDLKRTARADDVLAALKQNWSPSDQLLPIPEAEIQNNLGLRGAQNPGY